MKYLSIAVPIVIAMLGFQPSASHAYEIKNCSVEAQGNLKKPANFITKNMSKIVDQYTFLTVKQRQEIVRKWPNIHIKCNDSGTTCKKNNFTGHAHGGPGNTINICHDRMVDRGYSTCDAVGTMFHEMGHAHGFRMTPGHNDPTKYIRENDIMYRMGDLADDYCVNEAGLGNVVDAPFKGDVRKALGDRCVTDKDCTTGKCSNELGNSPPGQPRGFCICNDDDDCPGNQQCYKPLTKVNYCSKTNKKIGAECKKNSQCASDKCEKGECVCKDDGDCLDFPKRNCKKPLTKKNYCE